MEVAIKSHTSAEIFLKNYPHKWDVVVVTNPGTIVPKDIFTFSKTFLQLIFDDIDYQYGNFVAPNKDDVIKALEYAKDKEHLVVTCFGGISRSAALAYVIRCKELNDPAKAIKCLIPLRHHPNRLIIGHAAEILEDRRVYDVYNSWLQKPIILEQKTFHQQRTRVTCPHL